MTKKTKGTPDEVDKYVGQRLRVRRSLLGMSQEKLANAIGLTFQQIQKYERGLNRISAGMLFKFSRILEIPFDYFATGFDDCEKLEFEDFLQDKKTLTILQKYKTIQEKNPDFSKTMNTFLNLFLKD